MFTPDVAWKNEPWFIAAWKGFHANADRILAIHGGDIAKARESISELAYGNVSLKCRGDFQPVDQILRQRELEACR